MATSRIILVDGDEAKLASLTSFFRSENFSILALSSGAAVLRALPEARWDLILLGLELPDMSGFEVFHQLASGCARSGTFIAPIIGEKLTVEQRSRAFLLKADGFITEPFTGEELLATVRALLRQKQRFELLKEMSSGRAAGTPMPVSSNDLRENHLPGCDARVREEPLRSRCPQLYHELVMRYEEAVKQVLQHRIYKISDDAFGPFREIARELFMANATARDTVELHYHTLRKLAASPEHPSAQGYLEVGRTTIVGLLGDLLMYYRLAHQKQEASLEPVSLV